MASMQVRTLGMDSLAGFGQLAASNPGTLPNLPCVGRNFFQQSRAQCFHKLSCSVSHQAGVITIDNSVRTSSAIVPKGIIKSCGHRWKKGMEHTRGGSLLIGGAAWPHERQSERRRMQVGLNLSSLSTWWPRRCQGDTRLFVRVGGIPPV